VRYISDVELEAIYKRNDWAAVRGYELPAGVDLAVFDFGVNSGPSRSIRSLQKVLGVTIDGHIGPATLAAVGCHDPRDLIEQLQDERRRFVRQIRHYPYFKNGWERRITEIEERAHVMASGILKTPLHGIEAPAEVAAGRATETPPTSMAQSTTGQAATAAGTGGSAQMGMDAAAALQKVTEGGVKPFAWGPFLIDLATKPSFWIGVLVVASAAYVWIERRRKMQLGTP